MYVQIFITLATILLMGLPTTYRRKESAKNIGGSNPAIKVTLTCGGSWLGPIKQQIRTEDGVSIVIWMTNTGDQPLKVCASDTLSQDRPMLLRNGRLLSYRKSVLDLLEKNFHPPLEISRSPEMIEVRPNAPTMVDWFILSEGRQHTANIKWYESLEPGSYRLSVWRSLGCWNGKRIKSETIKFEIVP